MLSDKQIDEIAESMPGGIEGFLKGLGWNQFAHAVEAEVRKQDTELIRQMLAVLEYVRDTPTDQYDSKKALEDAKAAITAARARLEPKP